MKQEDIEKAWAIMSMHNSELLLRVAELEKQLEEQLTRRTLWWQLRSFFRGKQ